jgi:DNA topoisomerase-3
MRLIIAEKPSMGRDVAAALGATRRGEGFVEGPNDIVTWAIGHLVELEDPQVYDSRWARWSLQDLPIIPEPFRYRPNERTVDQFNVIKKLLARSDVTSVVNAADAGREGELIFDLVYTLARCRKPVERLWISSLTRDAILEGFKRLRPASEYTGLRDSAHARQQADWLVGLNATRAQTKVAEAAGRQGIYSLGRVQTPTLALIVQRDREIREFVPTQYFEVHADFELPADRQYRGVWVGKEGSRLDSKERAEQIASLVRGKPGIVERLERKRTRERPPLLYDLTSLQRAANARYGFSAARSLEIAQGLYEKKLLTYPRTSSRHLSRAVAADLRPHVEAAGDGPYAPFVAKIVGAGRFSLTSRHVDDKKVTDHHAIIPTRQRVTLSALTDDERRLYGLVVRRFLGAFYPDAEIEHTVITTLVEGERFRTAGTVVLQAGWREVDPPGKEAKRPGPAQEGAAGQEADESEKELPPVKQGENVHTALAEAVAKQTKAPQRHSEATLLGAMETAGKKIDDEEMKLAMKDCGLGTPATRAAIIETLIKREYVERHGKQLLATAKGEEVINALAFPLLKSAQLTGDWEAKLARMARGEYARGAFLSEIQGVVREMVRAIAGSPMERSQSPGASAPRNGKPTDLPCPKCARAGKGGEGQAAPERGSLVEIASATSGKFLVCSLGRDVCGYSSDVPRNAKQRKALVETSCSLCGAGMRLRLPKEKGKPAALTCSNFPACRGVRWFDAKSTLEPPGEAPEQGPPCALCNAPTVKRGPAKSGNYFWSCTGWRRDGTGCSAPPVWIPGGPGPQPSANQPSEKAETGSTRTAEHKALPREPSRRKS